MENKRLTKKIKRYGYVLNHKEDFTENSYQVIQKLGKLEDIEEKLGCPLDVLFIAMTSQIYYDIASGTGIVVQPFLVVNEDGMFTFDTMGETDDIFLNDYKQTWWLKEDRSE